LYDEVYATLPKMAGGVEVQMGSAHALWR
jgi:hypothetical protein